MDHPDTNKDSQSYKQKRGRSKCKSDSQKRWTSVDISGRRHWEGSQSTRSFVDWLEGSDLGVTSPNICYDTGMDMRFWCDFLVDVENGMRCLG